MFRDELKQPLRKKSLAQRLWAQRPGLLLSAYVVTAAAFVGGGTWAVLQPMPFAGEPILTVSVPPPEEVKTASIEAEAEVPDIDPATADAVEPEEPEVRISDANVIFVHRGQVLLDSLQT